MFDDLYPEQAAAAVNARTRRPADPTPAPSRFSLWSTTTAAPRGVAAGAAEAAGSTSDLLGGFGSVLGAMPGSSRGMFSTGTAEERKQINEARTKLLKDGPDYMSEGGRSFRNVAKDYSPDPATAHIAEQTVFNLFRVGSKALTAAAVGGNVPGAVVAGLEEGFTQADQLAQQGVDVNTRTQVGAVTALTNAVGFALPVAGKTWAQTAGLALAGGPASFMAQNAATREILQRADYGKLADQYDPFDPVGLALSTVLPLGFGALAMRGKGAAAGRPVPDLAPVPDAAVDAARVALVRQQIDAANPVPGDIEAVAAHDAAHTAALEQITSGQRVDVAQMLEITPEQRAANFSAWFGDSKVVDADGKPLVVYHGTHESFDTFDPQKIGSATDPGYFGEGFYFTKSPDEAASYTGMDGSNVMPVFVSLKNPYEMPSQSRFDSREAWKAALKSEGERLGVDLEGDPKAISEALRKAGYDGVVWRSARGADEYVAFEASQIKSAIGNSGRFDPNSASLTDPVAQIAERMAARIEQAGDPMPAPVVRPVPEAAPARADVPQFDYTATARQAADLLNTGESAAQIVGRAQASGQPLAPELQNMLVGLSEFGGRSADLLAQIDALKAKAGDTAPMDVIANAVERMRAGQGPDVPQAAANPLEARLQELEGGNPTALESSIAVEFGDDGKPTRSVTLREYLDTVKAEAAQEAADANLLQVAANCFLTSGA